MGQNGNSAYKNTFLTKPAIWPAYQQESPDTVFEQTVPKMMMMTYMIVDFLQVHLRNVMVQKPQRLQAS